METRTPTWAHALTGDNAMSNNPRRANSSRRNKVIAWLRSQVRPCWICGLPINYSLEHGHPESFECDELIPISKGGSPYVRDNVDAAHRCCNNWRGNKSVASVAVIAAQVRSKYIVSSPLDFISKARAIERHVPPKHAHRQPPTSTTW